MREDWENTLKLLSLSTAVFRDINWRFAHSMIERQSSNRSHPKEQRKYPPEQLNHPKKQILASNIYQRKYKLNLKITH